MYIVVLFALVAIFFVGSGVLHLGTTLAGVERTSYGRAMGTTAVGWIVGSVLAGILAVLHLNESFLALVLGAGVNLFVIKSMYGTSWGKALIAWVVDFIAFLILGGALVFFVIGGAVSAGAV